MENLVKLTIDGVSVEVPAGTTVLEAAKKAGINIPTLCYLKDINQIGACRMCIVDTGARAFGAACSFARLEFHARTFKKPSMSIWSISCMRQPASSREL